MGRQPGVQTHEEVVHGGAVGHLDGAVATDGCKPVFDKQSVPAARLLQDDVVHRRRFRPGQAVDVFYTISVKLLRAAQLAKEVVDVGVAEFEAQAVDGQGVGVQLREEPVKSHREVAAQAVAGYVEPLGRFFDQTAPESEGFVLQQGIGEAPNSR